MSKVLSLNTNNSLVDLGMDYAVPYSNATGFGITTQIVHKLT